MNNVICVPGVFFDVNPGELRSMKTSKCISHVRFSYGPPMRNLVLGMKQIEKVIDYWRGHHRVRRETIAEDNPSLHVLENLRDLDITRSTKMF